MKSHLYHLHALTALHVGIGQGSGVIDLPIAREKSTYLPLVPGSALKGVLREELRPENGEDRKAWEALFGPDQIRASDDSYAGALAVGDTRLLCLPVRAHAGTFAYATCPLVLRRYVRDCEAADEQNIPSVPNVQDGHCRTLADSALRQDTKVCLEDLDLDVQDGTGDWADWIARQVFPDDADWQGIFKARFAVLPDAIFDFLSETATEIRARVRLKENTRTVAKGALWYEENLPAESVLWGLLGGDRSFHKNYSAKADELIKHLPQGETRLQIGGKATVGRGQVRWLMTDKED